MPKVLVALATLLCIGCYNPKKFDVTIEHKTGKTASMQVTINPKYIKVTIKSKSFLNVGNSSSFKRDISKTEAVNFFNKLNALQLDTLKNNYIGNLENNEESHIIIARKEYNTITTHLQNTKTPATDSLIKFVDKLITNENFRYNSEQ